MTDQLRDRLRKVYELVNKGATEGEKQAAKAALDRLMKKYNLSEESLADVTKRACQFKYSTQLEEWLLGRLIKVMLTNTSVQNAWKYTGSGKKDIHIKMEYVEYVTLECAYEYFRRHMKGEWNRVCSPEIKRKRKAKTKNELRAKLQLPFFSRYCYASKLFKDHELISDNDSDDNRPPMTKEELERILLLRYVQGGQYNRQVVTAHQLGEAKKPIPKGGQFQLFEV